MSVEEDVKRLEDKVEEMGQTVAVTASRTTMILDEMKAFRKGMQAEATKGHEEVNSLGKIMTAIDARFTSHEKEDNRRFSELRADTKKSAGVIGAVMTFIVSLLEFFRRYEG